VPRVINKVCDRALQSACAGRLAVVNRPMVEGTEPVARSSHATVKTHHPMPTALEHAGRATPSAVPGTAELSDPVEDWLNSIEDAFVNEANRPLERPRFAPHTHARVTPSRVPRKWTRCLEALAFGLVLLLVALMLRP
jgi:hypothetical protein